MSDKEFLDPSELREGPIRNKSLPPELLENIKTIFDTIGQYLGTTLEQFEIGFMRDMHPEREVVAWSHVTLAWVAYHKQFLGGRVLPVEEERKIVSTLVQITTGMADVADFDVPPKVGKRLLQCFKDLLKKGK